MKIKKSTLIVIALLAFTGANAQVNLQTGSVQYTIPVHGYKDPLSRLSWNVGLNYNSQQGLKVNEVSSVVGTGWQVSGVSFVTRIQRGLPDDQVPREGNWDDTTKYPPGYLYNSKPSSDGCPNAIAQYPIFKDKDTYYTNHNTTDADREADYFMYSLNGRTGEFVIGKDWNVQLLDNAKVSITVMRNTDCSECRTSINQFVIFDENGIRYDFGTKENTKIYTYRPFYMMAHSNGMVPFTVNKTTEIPLDQKPFVTQAWFADRITDTKANRQIQFEYEYQLNDYNGPVAAQYMAPLNDIDNNTPGGSVPINYRKTIINQNRITIKKPELKKVFFPTGEVLELRYEQERKDISGTQALTSFVLTNADQQRLQKVQLTQQYFVKNQIKDPDNTETKWARLCLTGVQKMGENNADKEGPYTFGYYTGTNATEDFVPPYFFHAQDPWGYYNGSYCGVQTANFLNVMVNTGWKTLCLYNDIEQNGMPPAGGLCEFTTNAKTGYAKNGLLQQVTEPYGGQTRFEYEQNKVDNSLVCATDAGAAGGVHVTKVIQVAHNGSDDMVTTYKYENADGSSSLWGVEAPHNKKPYIRIFEPQSQYAIPFGVGTCGYRYKYPGTRFESLYEASPSIIETYRKIRGYLNKVSQLTNLGTMPAQAYKLPDANVVGLNLIANLSYDFLLQTAISCYTDYSTREDYMVHYNSPVNFANTLPIQFKRVEVSTQSLPSQLKMGKVIQEFTSDSDYPLLYTANNYPYMGGNRYYKWVYGLPKTVKVYNNNQQLVKEDSYAYQLTAAVSTDTKTASCQCEVRKTQSYRNDFWDQYATSDYATVDNVYQYVRHDNVTKGRMERTQTTEKLYDDLGNSQTMAINYSYNPVNNQIAVTQSTDSKGVVTENKTYYLEDYDLNVPANQLLKDMYLSGLRNIPISAETWQTQPGGQPQLVAATVTEYGTAPNGDYRPMKTYALQTDAPVPQSQIGVFNPQQLIRSSLMAPMTQTTYDMVGNAVQNTELRGNRTSSTVYDYDNRYAVAMVTNAAASEVAYTSFEAEGSNSRWQTSQNIVLTETSPTGNNCLQLFHYPVTTTVPISKDYVLSFWATTNTVTVTGAGSPTITGPTINGWTYYEYRLPSGSPSPLLNNTASNMCKIDELRLYPATASMVTTAYAPGIGKTSVCDANNRIAYFTYDGFGRASKEKDARGNVLKTYEYHYQQQ